MKQVLAVTLLVCGCLSAGHMVRAQAQTDEALIRKAVAAQAEAWNRGDIPGFMQSYEKSPQTTFIGANIGKGYEKILERYQKNYTNRDQMGSLTFNDLEVRLLPG